jgi:hypothetical protein
MYFKKFGEINYRLGEYSKPAKNILKAVLPKFNNVNGSFVFQKYMVSSGQRPETVANELYSEPNYHWVLLVLNNIVNPFVDWPMADEEVELFTERKYGVGEAYSVHHFYWRDTGKWLDEVDEATQRALYPNNPEDVIPVTNLQFEIETNRERKSIIAINPKYIQQFVEAYNQALEGKE